jgi:hypothetical protein
MGLLELEVEGLGCDQGDQGDRECDGMERNIV